MIDLSSHHVFNFKVSDKIDLEVHSVNVTQKEFCVIFTQKSSRNVFYFKYWNFNPSSTLKELIQNPEALKILKEKFLEISKKSLKEYLQDKIDPRLSFFGKYLMKNTSLTKLERALMHLFPEVVL